MLPYLPWNFICVVDPVFSSFSCHDLALGSQAQWTSSLFCSFSWTVPNWSCQSLIWYWVNAIQWLQCHVRFVIIKGSNWGFDIAVTKINENRTKSKQQPKTVANIKMLMSLFVFKVVWIWISLLLEHHDLRNVIDIIFCLIIILVRCPNMVIIFT